MRSRRRKRQRRNRSKRSARNTWDGAAGGRWVEDNDGSLYLNDDVLLSGVPAKVWQYELGGYPVMKKWLGYRHVSRLGGRALTLAELDQLRGIAQRIATILELRPALDDLQGRLAEDAFTAEELRVKKAHSTGNDSLVPTKGKSRLRV